MLQITESKNGLSLRVKVQPGAPADKILGEHDGGLKLRLKAPPVDGKANAACIKFLADLLDLPKSNIELVKGETSTIKMVRIAGVTREVLLSKLRNFL
jgi:hypothetical protein